MAELHYYYILSFPSVNYFIECDWLNVVYSFGGFVWNCWVRIAMSIGIERKIHFTCRGLVGCFCWSTIDFIKCIYCTTSGRGKCNIIIGESLLELLCTEKKVENAKCNSVVFFKGMWDTLEMQLNYILVLMNITRIVRKRGELDETIPKCYTTVYRCTLWNYFMTGGNVCC